MRVSVGFLFAVMVSFLTAVTVANEPYLFFGYGLGAFALLVVGLLLEPIPATVGLFIGNTLGIALVAYTQSAFTLVVVGAVLIRTLQVYLLSRLKSRISPVGAAAVAVVFGALVATALGFGFYGGDAISTPMAIFEAVYIPPALLVMKAFGGQGRDGKLLGSAIFVATCGVFFSASPFGILPGALTSLAVLIVASALVVKPGIVTPRRVGSLLLIVALFAVPSSLAASPTHLSYNLRTTLYPFYPDSLAKTQWVQGNSSLSCVQGSIAGAGTTENGLWGPQRLRVLATCVTVTGVVQGIAPTSGPAYDGDLGMDIKLDPQYSYMLSLGSYVFQNGDMHVEVVPSQQASMAGVLSSLKPGERVAVVGAFTIDTDHGYWSEIHPAWLMTVQGQT